MDDEIRERYEVLTSRLPVDSRIESEHTAKSLGVFVAALPSTQPTPISVPARCLLRGPHSNRFCVPAALALLLECHVDHAVALIRQEVGEQPIEGIFYPLILKILQKQGYKFVEVRQTFDTDNSYLICFAGHVGTWIEGRYYDNQFPNGSDETPRRSIQRIFRVWKVAP